MPGSLQGFLFRDIDTTVGTLHHPFVFLATSGRCLWFLPQPLGDDDDQYQDNNDNKGAHGVL